MKPTNSFDKKQPNKPQAPAAENSSGKDRNCSTSISVTFSDKRNEDQPPPDVLINIRTSDIAVELHVTFNRKGGDSSGVENTVLNAERDPKPVTYRHNSAQDSGRLLTWDDSLQ